MKKSKPPSRHGLPKSTNLKEYPRDQSIAWTISLPERVVIPMTKINPKPPYELTKKGRPKPLAEGMKWKNMSQDMQHNYIKYEYTPDLFKYCGINYFHMFFELNKRGMVHAHAVIYSDTPGWDVHVYRAKCRHHSNAVCIHLGQNESKLNSIHLITEPDAGDPEWVDYIYKDYYKNPMVPLISQRIV